MAKKTNAIKRQYQKWEEFTELLAPGITVGHISLTTSTINKRNKPEMHAWVSGIAKFGTYNKLSPILA